MDDLDSDADEPTGEVEKVQNPDEIVMDDMDDSDEDEEPKPVKVSEEVEATPLESVDRIEEDPAMKSVDVPIKADEEGITEALAEVEDQVRAEGAPSSKKVETRFLALDKCGPHKQFIQVGSGLALCTCRPSLETESSLLAVPRNPYSRKRFSTPTAIRPGMARRHSSVPPLVEPDAESTPATDCGGREKADRRRSEMDRRERRQQGHVGCSARTVDRNDGIYASGRRGSG